MLQSYIRLFKLVVRVYKKLCQQAVKLLEAMKTGFNLLNTGFYGDSSCLQSAELLEAMKSDYKLLKVV